MVIRQTNQKRIDFFIKIKMKKIFFFITLCFCINNIYSQQSVSIPCRFPQINSDTDLCHENFCFFVNGKITCTKGFFTFEDGQCLYDTIWFSQFGGEIFFFQQQYESLSSIPDTTMISICFFVDNYMYYLVSNVMDYEIEEVEFLFKTVPLSYFISYGKNNKQALCMITTTVPFPNYYKCSLLMSFKDCIISRYSTDDISFRDTLDLREYNFYFCPKGLNGHLWVE